MVYECPLDNVLRRWYPEIESMFVKPIPVILLGLKKDLRHDFMFYRELRHKTDRMCRVSEGRQVAFEINAVAHFECSAKTGEQLKQALIVAARAACGLHMPPPRTTICAIL